MLPLEAQLSKTSHIKHQSKSDFVVETRSAPRRNETGNAAAASTSKPRAHFFLESFDFFFVGVVVELCWNCAGFLIPKKSMFRIVVFWIHKNVSSLGVYNTY